MDNWLCHIYTLYYLLWNAVITYTVQSVYHNFYIVATVITITLQEKLPSSSVCNCFESTQNSSSFSV